jgi:hypothetical protein
MKITFEEQHNEIIYRVHDFDPKYEPILKMCFYQNDGHGYIKKYPKKAKYIENMQKRYAQNAKLMFDQLGYFTDIPWKDGLTKFCSMVQDSTIDWWLTGSCATCIHGIELTPHDVDIMVNSKSIDEITELFKDCLIEPIVDTNGWLTKDFGVMFMDVRIDIASDPSPVLDVPEPVDCGPYALNNLEIVLWNGFEIRVPPLELQLNVNRKRGRLDRVDKIADFLGKRRVNSL